MADLRGVDDETAAMDIVDREGVHVETAFLWAFEGTDYILTYFEAEEAARVREVYDAEMDAAEHEFVEAFAEVVAGAPEPLDAEPLYRIARPGRPTDEAN
ncbi:DUF6176 family protein [Salinirubellus salinus]|uniref:DUF6176 family protein n=1 Tax=Salinirubellus salinus TaxID=1364945 RepID=UPI00360D15E5